MSSKLTPASPPTSRERRGSLPCRPQLRRRAGAVMRTKVVEKQVINGPALLGSARRGGVRRPQRRILHFTLHDSFRRCGNDVMHRLRDIK